MTKTDKKPATAAVALVPANDLASTLAHPTIPRFSLIKVPGTDAFMMGGDGDDEEKPIHAVRLLDFYIGQYPVTQALWQAVMEENPSQFRGAERPVECVSWRMIRDPGGFLGRLNSDAETRAWLGSAGLGEYRFRLPSEAEWEYAARGGRDGSAAQYDYAGSAQPDAVAWYDDNSHGETKPVGLKAPNALGLYDMSGNVWEWCEDDWHDNYGGAPGDGSAWVDHPERSGNRVLRGGSWFFIARRCRAASRGYGWPGYRDGNVGLRLALSL